MTPSPLLRPLWLGALLGLHLGSQAAPAAPTEVRFDTVPRAGQHQRQQLDMRATMRLKAEPGPGATDEQRAQVAQIAERMAQDGPIKMSLQMTQTTRVGQPDPQGWLPVSYVAGDRKSIIEVGGKAVPVPNLSAGDLRITARFNPQDFAFEIQDVQGGMPGGGALLTQQGQAMLSDAFKLHKALAQRSLKTGDSVDVPLSLSLPVPMPGSAGNLQGQVRYTLVRVERGVAHFELAMTLDAQVDTPLPAPPAASAASAPDSPPSTPSTPSAPAPRLAVSMKGSASGTAALRLTDRLPLATQMALTMKATIDGPGNTRLLMDMDMTLLSKGEALSLRTAP